VEWFAANDVAVSTCAGTGLFVVPFTSGGVARALHVGEPLCDALRGPDVGVAPGPHGHRVVYSRSGAANTAQLVSLDLRGADARVISDHCSPSAREPAISPDGRMIAMSGLCDGRDQRESAVYVATIEGASRRRVIGGDTVSARMPAWSPDGVSLVVRLGDATAPPRSHRLAVVDLRTNKVRPLVSGASPSWSPDGRWIAYVHRDSVSLDDVEVRIIKPDGTEIRTLFRNQTQTTYVRGWGPMREGMVRGPLLWSSGSDGIVFSRAFDRGVSLWFVPSSGTPARQVTESTQR
jgi:tricorn protease-like protein